MTQYFCRDNQYQTVTLKPETPDGTPAGAQAALRIKFEGLFVEVDLWSDGTFAITGERGSIEGDFGFLYDDATEGFEDD